MVFIRVTHEVMKKPTVRALALRQNITRHEGVTLETSAFSNFHGDDNLVCHTLFNFVYTRRRIQQFFLKKLLISSSTLGKPGLLTLQ